MPKLLSKEVIFFRGICLLRMELKQHQNKNTYNRVIISVLVAPTGLEPVSSV